MASPPSKTIAVSAPGKVLLAGGYLATDRDYTGLVFGLNARINVIARDIPTSKGIQLTEIVVESPQFVGAQWRYGYHLVPNDGGIMVTQLHTGTTIDTNPFIETTLTCALTYISRAAHHTPTHSIKSAHLTLLADNDYYSRPSSALTNSSSSRFAHLGTTLADAKKTGLGSSAALVTSLTAALLTYYLSPSGHFDLSTTRDQRILHNLAQAAHCRAQGKIGSGFDVAAAVYGSCLYRRFSPAVLDSLPAAGSAGFGSKLYALVAETDEVEQKWDTEIGKDDVALPIGVVVRLCDVACGTQTVGMVKRVNEWRVKDPEGSKALWDELQARNEELAAVLKNEGDGAQIKSAIEASRALVRKMGSESGVPIEPESQTELLDGLSGLEGVYGGVVPGAGGYDAIALLVREEKAVEERIERFLEDWSQEKGRQVRLLKVRGELEGARAEKLEQFEGWL